MEDEKKDTPEKKKDRFVITELFLGRNPSKGWEDTYWSAIIREKDEAGNEIAVNGKVDMRGDGSVWSREADEKLYGNSIDTIIELRIEYKIHGNPGVSSKIGDNKFYHN